MMRSVTLVCALVSLTLAVSACTPSDDTESLPAAPDAALAPVHSRFDAAKSAYGEADRVCGGCPDAIACQQAITSALQRTTEALQGPRSQAQGLELKEQFLGLARLSDECATRAGATADAS